MRDTGPQSVLVVVMEAMDATLKAKELELREREIALRERESVAKTRTERRGILLSSPVLIAAVSTIFGTVLGAGIQAYSSFNAEKNKQESSLQLERMKFEFSLVQKAFEEPDRDEAANQLLFLANSGVIRDLNATQLKTLAQTPEDLPLFTRLPSSSTEAHVIAAIGSTGIIVGQPGKKNIRSGPNAVSEAVYTLDVGERVTILERTTDDEGAPWYRIASGDEGRQGWVAAHLLDVERLGQEKSELDFKIPISFRTPSAQTE